MHRVPHHGRDTAYRLSDRDGGVPLVCIHGSGGSHAVWRGQFRLSEDHPIAAIDLSGHGASDDVAVDATAGEASLEAYADDVVAVARNVGARVLVGNSLGGAVALRVALERDLALDALVLAGTGAKLRVLPDLLEWLDDDFERAIEFLHGPDRLFHAVDDRVATESREAIRAAGPAVTARDFRTCDAFDVRDRLGEIAVPALAVTGEYDELTPPHYHEYLAEHLPRGRWTTVDDAAHLSMLERPDAFNRAVRAFLDDALDPEGKPQP